MAIYGDGKHNENIEHNAPKYEVTDSVVYKTTHWTIEGNDDIYHVQCQEDDLFDYWYITSENEGDIDPDSETGTELISICEEYYIET